jgi:hypothetical protein
VLNNSICFNAIYLGKNYNFSFLLFQDMKNTCVLPAAEGVLYSYEDSDKILSHGTLIKQHRVVIENCDVGYDKAYPNGLRICQGNGEWISNSTNLCFSKLCIVIFT